MSNDFYTHTGFPPNSSEGKSGDLRAELLSLQAAFDKMPLLATNPNKIILVNAAGTGLTITPIGSYQNNVAWVPVLTFATPGDLSVAYTSRIGTMSRVGQLIKLSFSLQTSTFTHTTASGALQITGAPIITGGGFVPLIGPLTFGGITKASYTQFVLALNGLTITIYASGSGQSQTQVVAADCPTGGTIVLNGTIWYEGGT